MKFVIAVLFCRSVHTLVFSLFRSSLTISLSLSLFLSLSLQYPPYTPRPLRMLRTVLAMPAPRRVLAPFAAVAMIGLGALLLL